MKRVTALLSFTGRVLGMAATAVKPPAAAAWVPDKMVSLYSSPGSRRWTCMSMSPGVTTRLRASITRRPSAEMVPGASTAAILTTFDQQVPGGCKSLGGVNHQTALYE